jgi:WD40 repeat protein
MEEPVINGGLLPMRRLGVSPDGRQVLAPGRGQAVTLWDLESGTVVVRGFGHWNNPIALGFGKGTLASVGEDGQAMVHDTATGQELRRIPFSHEGGMTVGYDHGAAILAGGRTALTEAWSDGHRLVLIDLEHGRILRKFEGHQDAVVSIGVDREGRRAVSAGLDGVRLWDLEGGAEVEVLPVQAESVAMDPEGRFAALGLRSGRIQFQPWPAATRPGSLASEHALFTGQGLYGYSALAFAPDGRTLWTASGPQVQAWSFPEGRLARTFGFPTDPAAGRTRSIVSIALAPDGRHLLTGTRGPGPGLCVWDLRTGEKISEASGEPREVRFSFDGSSAYTTDGARLAITDLETGRVEREEYPSDPPWIVTEILAVLRTGHDAPSGAERMTLSADARWALVAFARHHDLVLWDCEEHRVRTGLGGHKRPVTALALSPDAGLAASGDERGLLRVRATFQGWRSLTVQAHAGAITAICFSGDGTRFATGGQDGVIQVWDARKLSRVCTLRGAIQEVAALAISPDGRWVAASGPFDGAVHVWRVP